MSCYLGTGFSIPEVNEIFVPTGDTQSGQPIYENESTGQFLFYYDGYNTVYIDDIVTAPPTNPVEYYNLTSGTDPVGTYEISSGPSYAGDIEETTCPSVPDPDPSIGTSTTATSTEALLLSLNLGMGIMIFLMSLMLVAWVYNSFTKKKWL